ncbi:MAG: spermine synthase, partial [Candidatus Omnitrophota bacterium]|nr:spermine synthase [Candidatus Omnitrophota bacterium]
KSALFTGFITCIAMLAAVGPGRLEQLSRGQQWRGMGLIDNRNSPYGNIALTAKAGQKTFFYNGATIITTPDPDTAFVEEFGNFPLLFHPAPRQVLVVGAGAGGLLNEILKHPHVRIDYAELDPLIIKMLKLYPCELTERELSDKRVNLINSDGRRFLHKTRIRYDLILIGLSQPSDLITNRLFTEEFFSLAKTRLNKNGIIALWLPGSLTYISKELRDLNACILNGLNARFVNTRVIPGDYNIILASDWQGLIGVTAAELSGRLAKLGIKTSLLNPAYLEYRLGEGWVKWFNQSQAQATQEINRDLQPFAVFQMLIFWNKQFSFRLARVLQALQGLNLKLILSAIAVISILLLPIFRRRPKFSIAYCIATTGFFGMLVNLLLIFSFQVFYGCLYYMLGLLIAVFMAGIASGSALITRSIDRLQSPVKLLIRLEVMIALFTLALGWALTRFSGWVSSYWVFIPLFFLPGFLLGLEFPLASRIYLGNKGEVGATVGLLCAADLLGGWVAGILGGIIFLPILGLFNTCLVIVLLKISSIFLLKTSNPTYGVE